MPGVGVLQGCTIISSPGPSSRRSRGGCGQHGRGRGTIRKDVPECSNKSTNITHTFDNHSHRAGVPRLELCSNHGEPTLLTLASRCGSVGPLLRPGECTTTPVPLGEHDGAGGSRPQYVTGLFTESPFPSTLRRECAPRSRDKTDTGSTGTQPSQEGGKMSVGRIDSRNAAPRPTARSKTRRVVEFSTNYDTPHPHHWGGAI